MGNSETIISLPQGGGAIQGIGETFSPDLFTGTGNFSVPIALPTGRNGFQPQLNLQYSTGNGNDVFGLGWLVSIPAVSRKTSDGIPRYQDQTDVFVLSGAEDLVPVAGSFPGIVRYMPRTEGLFARIEYHRDDANSFWAVQTKDGLTSTYGTPDSLGHDPAAISDPDDPRRIFAWKLSETRDLFGNRIRYEYERDQQENAETSQLYLRRIQYVDLDGPQPDAFLASVDFIYNDRPDQFSNHRSGFRIQTTRRCNRIEVRTQAEISQRVRTYQFVYLDQRINPFEGENADAPITIGDVPVEPLDETALPPNGVSLLSQIHVIGHDDSSPAGPALERLPPLEFSYSQFTPDRRDLISLSGRDLPAQALSAPELELVDLFGNGLPDLIEMNGAVRYWRNLGRGRFDLPRQMNEAPAGVSIADNGVQLIDANGDGRTDLLVTRPELSGYYPLRFNGFWDRRSFQRYSVAPSFDLKSEHVRLVDLNGDGVIDAIRTDNRLEHYFNDPHEGWGETRRVERRPLAEFPDVQLADPRVRWADMSGDGLEDIVMVYEGNIEYWPNLGHGNWGARTHMSNSPRLPFDYDPRQVLIGDIDGDGAADLVFVDHGKITLWINQSGNSWSGPIEIDGTPEFTNQDDVRLVDLMGVGVAGILWSLSPLANRRERGFFLDLTGRVKPYLLNRMNNHRGAIAEVSYHSSTEEYLRDQTRPETRWKTTLPFPVQVVSKVVSIDEFSRGRLITDYRYHHGYWDGGEREFRGFGCVEVLNTETFEDYFNLPAGGFASVEPVHYSPPTLTKSWFHLGPVGEEFGDWEAVDHNDEYWPGDAPFFAGERDALQEFLGGLERRRNRRDALRALRGSSLRTELYALDDSPRVDRPYTVTESVYGLREVDAPTDENSSRRRIFFPHLLGQRTTQWERGDDPSSLIRYVGDYDDYGQPRRQIEIGCPRAWRNFESDSRPGTDYLTTHIETRFAQRDDDLYLVDRVAGTSTFQIFPPHDQPAPSVTVSELRQQAFTGSARRELTAQTLNYFDGEAFAGLPLGQVGQFGALVRSEILVMTEAILTAAYQGDDPDTPPATPPYLDPSGEVNWLDEYPERFRQAMPSLAGYRFHAGDADHARGYFIDSVSNNFDFQTAAIADPRGMLIATRDALGREIAIDHDQFALLPVQVTDPAGLRTSARNDYRVLQPHLVTEPNGNRTAMTFTPLGLPNSVAVMGKEDEPAGDTLDAPGTRFEYDLLAYDDSTAANRQPVSIRTIRRVHHVNDTEISIAERDDTVESVEYSDGFGRVLQTRMQAEDILWGDDTFGNETLPADPTDAVGTGALIAGRRRTFGDPPNVVVSGWQIYDNKGQVVQNYEPFFDIGWNYLSLEEAQALREQGIRDLFGQSVRQFYDPRGQVIRTINPAEAEQRIIYGIPPDLTEPDNFNPTPWEAYTYDANDLAPLSQGPDGAPRTDRAPVDHHFTPTSIEIDALGRTTRSVQRNGLGPENEIASRSTYDMRGNVLSLVDGLGRTAFSYVYDLGNKPVRVFSIDAGIKRTVFDAAGNAVEVRDSKGALVLSRHDELNRAVDVWARDDSIQPVTLRQHVVYGENGAELAVGESEARFRNALGRMLARYDEAGREVFVSYDFKGNLGEKTRQVIADDQLLSIFEGAAENDWEIPVYQVDWEAGASIDERATAILDPIEYTTSTLYDALNRVVEVEYPRDVEGERKILSQTYNRAGAVETITLADRVYVERIAYNARGQRTLIAFGNGIMTRYAHDPHTFKLSRLRSERYTRPDDSSYQPTATAIQDFAYEYDLAGNTTAIRDRSPESGVPNTLPGADALDRQFVYDALYRLISATGRECDVRDPLPPWLDEPRCTDITRVRTYTESYQYDQVGNMLVLQHQNASGGFTRDFSPAANNNRLETLTIGQTVLSYSYDANGNLRGETTSRHFEWNCSDRLKAFRTQTAGAEPSIHEQYLYDASGQRIKKLVRRQGGQFNSTAFIDAVFEHHLRISAGETRANNLLHVSDIDARVALVRVGDPFPGDSMPGIQFQLEDHLGSSNVIAGLAGDFLNREEYTPYGETSFGSFSSKRYRFQGNERDESGLCYHGARYYAPWLTRWATPDPLGPADGPNSYVFVKSNPLNFTDPIGLNAKPSDKLDPHKCYEGPAIEASVQSREDFDNLTPEQKETLRKHWFSPESFKPLTEQSLYEGPSLSIDRGTSRPPTSVERGEGVGTLGEQYIQQVAELQAMQREMQNAVRKNNKAFLQTVGSLVPGVALIYLRTNLKTGEYYIGQTTTNETRDEFARQMEHDRKHGESFNYRVLWEGPNNTLTQLSNIGGRRVTTTVEIVEQFYIDAYRPLLGRQSNVVNSRVWNEAVRLGLVAASLSLGTMTATYNAPLSRPVTQPLNLGNRSQRRRAPLRIPVRGK